MCNSKNKKMAVVGIGGVGGFLAGVIGNEYESRLTLVARGARLNTLKEQGISVTFVDPSDPENFRKAIQPNTKLLYGETLGNPNSDVLDLEA